jgi:GPH family glycoside/pentoside/hexuronide:cation symporter
VATLLPAYYASSLHVDLAEIGIFLLASRSLDVVIDPMIGKWSDSTPARFGRRKLWMWLGTPLIMGGAYLLLIPPLRPNGWYLLLASFVIYVGGSAMGLSYSAWGTEIVDTYHGRSRMAAFRETFGLIGSLTAAGIPAIGAALGHGIDRFTMGIFGWTIIVVTPLTVLIAILAVGEVPTRAREANAPWLRSLTDLWGNVPFRLLCGAYLLFSLGGSIVTATMVFYITYYLRQKEIVTPAFAVLPLCIVASIPLWLFISRRIGKHRAIAYSLFSSMGIFLVLVPQLHAGQGWWFVGIVAALAVISGGYQVLPSGIIGDVIDYDTLKHHEVRGGIYWGVWSFAQKIAPALGIGITLPLLKLMGFNPAGHSTATGLDALKYAYCFAIIPFLFAGGLLLMRFPIDSRRHDIIRRRLEARAQREKRTQLESMT